MRISVSVVFRCEGVGQERRLRCEIGSGDGCTDADEMAQGKQT